MEEDARVQLFNHADGAIWDAIRLQLGQIGRRIFDQKARIAAQQQILANHIDLAGLAQTGLLPFCVIGHNLVDFGQRDLHEHDADQVRAIIERHAPKGRRNAITGAVEFKINQLHGAAVRIGVRQFKGVCFIALAVGPTD